MLTTDTFKKFYTQIIEIVKQYGEGDNHPFMGRSITMRTTWDGKDGQPITISDLTHYKTFDDFIGLVGSVCKKSGVTGIVEDNPNVIVTRLYVSAAQVVEYEYDILDGILKPNSFLNMTNTAILHEDASYLPAPVTDVAYHLKDIIQMHLEDIYGSYAGKIMKYFWDCATVSVSDCAEEETRLSWNDGEGFRQAIEDVRLKRVSNGNASQLDVEDYRWVLYFGIYRICKGDVIRRLNDWSVFIKRTIRGRALVDLPEAVRLLLSNV